MVFNILVIGDVGNYFKTVSKYVKNSKIRIINFPKDGAGIYTYDENYELFENYKVADQVKKISQIKEDFDLAVVMGTGERIAYLADLNYVSYYVGRDIDAPRFIKNSKESWYKEPLHRLNFFERRFYKKTFDFAIAHIAPTWVFEHLKKFPGNNIKMDLKPIDLTLFNDNSEPRLKTNEKFTFFCPQRMGIPKGTDILWKALQFCKSDFQILQVDWRDAGTDEENSTSLRLRENLPSQVKLIPMIKRKDIPSYYHSCDAVIGNLRIGSFEYVELEAVMCKKPVINFTDKKIKISMDNKEIESPFIPDTNDPKDIAQVIDKLVVSDQFRQNIFKKEYDFVQNISDPKKAGEWWDSLFEKMIKENPSINRKSSGITVKLRMLSFLISNRLYFRKIKNYSRNAVSTYRISQFLYSIIRSVIGGKGFSKYKIIRKGKKFAENNIHSSHVSVQGHEMYLDSSDSLRLSTNGVFEPYTTEVIKQNISSGDLVIDIGANIGYFTLIMAKGITENGKVFSFEPEPKNFELLKKNVEINNYSNVILEKKAIGNKTGIAKLYLADRKNNIFYSGMHRIFRSDLVSQISNPVSINIIKLDDYLQDLKFIKKIRLIKIDVEGAEFDVLKGMSKILDENKGIKIVMEFSSENLEDYGSNPSDVMNFLINKGFKLSIINEVEKRMEEVTGIKGIIDSEAKKIGLNIFCSR